MATTDDGSAKQQSSSSPAANALRTRSERESSRAPPAARLREAVAAIVHTRGRKPIAAWHAPEPGMAVDHRERS